MVKEIASESDGIKPWRLGIQTQSFSFNGKASISSNDNFNLKEAAGTIMLGADICRNLNLSFGHSLTPKICLNFGYAQQKVNFKTSAGTTIPDVKLQAFKPELNAGLDWKPFRFPLFISADAGLGSYILSINSQSALANNTQAGGLYSLGASSRFEIMKVAYLQVGYLFRHLFAENSQIQIQPHNYTATAGFIF